MNLSWWVYIPAFFVVGWLVMSRRTSRPSLPLVPRGKHVAGSSFTPEKMTPVIALMVHHSYGYTPSARLTNQFARQVVDEANQVQSVR